jgi:hypothetical protein
MPVGNPESRNNPGDIWSRGLLKKTAGLAAFFKYGF